MKTFFSIMAVLLCTAIAQMAHAQQWPSFDTNGHPKAKGVWATVRYPSGWELERLDEVFASTSADTVKKFGYYDQRAQVEKNLFLQIVEPGTFEKVPDYNAMTEQEIKELMASSFSRLPQIFSLYRPHKLGGA